MPLSAGQEQLSQHCLERQLSQNVWVSWVCHVILACALVLIIACLLCDFVPFFSRFLKHCQIYQCVSDRMLQDDSNTLASTVVFLCIFEAEQNAFALCVCCAVNPPYVCFSHGLYQCFVPLQRSSLVQLPPSQTRQPQRRRREEAGRRRTKQQMRRNTATTRSLSFCLKRWV